MQNLQIISNFKYQPIEYYKALDGLRGYAVMMVLFHHARLITWGWIGVHIFFVLSGFLITKILLRTKGSNNYYKTFFVRRTLRIFPLYYGMLFTSIIYGYYRNATTEDAWLYIFYIQNFKLGFQNLVTDFVDWFDHTWTLAVEEQFYLVFPFIVAACNLKIFRLVCLSLIAAGIGSILLHSAIYESTMINVYHTVSCMLFLSSGALLATFSLSDEQTITKTLAVVSLITVTAFIIVVFFIPLKGSIQDTLNLKGQLYLITACPLIVLAVHMLSAYKSLVIRVFFENTVITYLGKISYGLYLFHYPVFILCYAHHLPPITSFVFTIILAVLSWHFFESKILALKYQFSGLGIMHTGHKN